MFAGKSARLLSTALALGVTGLAQAQDVATTKTAPANAVVNNITADLQLRYGSQISGTDDKEFYVPTAQLRSNINAVMFSEKVDSTLVIAGTKKNSTTQVVERRPELYNYFNLIVADNYALKPFVNVYFPSAGSGTNGEVGINPSVTTGAMNIPGGALTLSADANLYATLSSRPEDATVLADANTRAAFNLAPGANENEGKLVNGKDDPSYTAQYIGTAVFAPTAVKGLTLQTLVQFTNTYDPVYSLDTADGTRDVSFVNTPVVENQIKVSYALTEKTKLVNETWFKHGGLYESRIDSDATDSRFVNVAYVAYTLF